MTRKVLIIEDAEDIAKLLSLNLQDLGCQADCAADGQEGLQQALNHPYDLIILDLMLPGLDGLEVCKRIRAEKIHTPILMLTAKSEELDVVLGLELGADEYITKPFRIRELMARVKAIFRRMESLAEEADQKDNRIMKFGRLEIDLDKRKVMLSDELVDLTAKEFDLLVLFATHAGHCYSRQELLDEIWGYQFDGYDHTVNSHINRLRTKIEADRSKPKYIQTVWGVGYRFAEPHELET